LQVIHLLPDAVLAEGVKYLAQARLTEIFAGAIHLFANPASD
jgi:hypothetical protein